MSEQLYSLQNSAKFRGVGQMVDYDQFRAMVLASHLQPINNLAATGFDSLASGIARDSKIKAEENKNKLRKQLHFAERYVLQQLLQEEEEEKEKTKEEEMETKTTTTTDTVTKPVDIVKKEHSTSSITPTASAASASAASAAAAAIKPLSASATAVGSTSMDVSSTSTTAAAPAADNTSSSTSSSSSLSSSSSTTATPTAAGSASASADLEIIRMILSDSTETCLPISSSTTTSNNNNQSLPNYHQVFSQIALPANITIPTNGMFAFIYLFNYLFILNFFISEMFFIYILITDFLLIYLSLRLSSPLLLLFLHVSVYMCLCVSTAHEFARDWKKLNAISSPLPSTAASFSLLRMKYLLSLRSLSFEAVLKGGIGLDTLGEIFENFYIFISNNQHTPNKTTAHSTAVHSFNFILPDATEGQSQSQSDTHSESESSSVDLSSSLRLYVHLYRLLFSFACMNSFDLNIKFLSKEAKQAIAFLFQQLNKAVQIAATIVTSNSTPTPTATATATTTASSSSSSSPLPLKSTPSLSSSTPISYPMMIPGWSTVSLSSSSTGTTGGSASASTAGGGMIVREDIASASTSSNSAATTSKISVLQNNYGASKKIPPFNAENVHKLKLKYKI